MMNIDQHIINEAVNLLKEGEVIIFPTETVYALACDARNDKAIKKIYDLKGRDPNKPLAVLIKSIDQAKLFAEFDIRAEKLAAKFIPGALTLILNTKNTNYLSKELNIINNTIAVRSPDHLTALTILKEFGSPIIGTSVNVSGMIPATNYKEIDNIFKEHIKLIISENNQPQGIPSTIIDLTKQDSWSLVREGNISRQEIADIINI